MEDKNDWESIDEGLSTIWMFENKTENPSSYRIVAMSDVNQQVKNLPFHLSKKKKNVKNTFHLKYNLNRKRKS